MERRVDLKRGGGEIKLQVDQPQAVKDYNKESKTGTSFFLVELTHSFHFGITVNEKVTISFTRFSKRFLFLFFLLIQ